MTKIEWAHAGLGRGETWNPIRAARRLPATASDPLGATAIGWHCEKVSPGCAHCYAERQNVAGARGGTRLPYKPGHRGNGDVRVYLDEKTLRAPLSWKAPRGIFSCSMTDAFGAWVEDAWLDKMFAAAALCPQHIFIFVTKRPNRMRDYLITLGRNAERDRNNELPAQWQIRLAGANQPGTLPLSWCDVRRALGVDQKLSYDPQTPAWPLPNVWLGCTAEDQQRADERRDDMRALAEAGWTTIVSYEPALGPVDWTGWEFVSQIIFGGETGPNARPSHPQWARETRDFCAVHGVAYFHKQWGEWKPLSEMPEAEYDQFYRPNRLAKPGEDQDVLNDIYGCACVIPTEAIGYGGATGAAAFQQVDGKGGMTMFRVGRARAGRQLDGREHNQFPRAES